MDLSWWSKEKSQQNLCGDSTPEPLLKQEEDAGVGTFDRPPLCFPPEEPPAVDLVLLIAAHHCERDHLLLGDDRR